MSGPDAMVAAEGATGAVFLKAADYQDYSDDLRKVCGDHEARVLAYCLMPNHYHLCVRTGGDPLSVVMHRLNLRHARATVPGFTFTCSRGEAMVHA